MLNKQKGFVWNALRIGSIFSVVSYIIFYIIIFVASAETFQRLLIPTLILAIVCVLSLLFLFVISIIHLRKHKEKKFAMLILVITGLIILLALGKAFIAVPI